MNLAEAVSIDPAGFTLGHCVHCGAGIAKRTTLGEWRHIVSSAKACGPGNATASPRV